MNEFEREPTPKEMLITMEELFTPDSFYETTGFKFRQGDNEIIFDLETFESLVEVIKERF